MSNEFKVKNGIISGGDVSIKQMATPTSPDSGYLKYYPKEDGKLYCQTSTGTEKLVGDCSHTYREITQSSHGFDNDFIYHNGTTWVKAIATSIEVLATHFAISVDTNTFKAVLCGEVDLTGVTDANSDSLVSGEFYVLSDIVAGKVIIDSTVAIQQGVLKINESDYGTISIEIPLDIGDDSLNKYEIVNIANADSPYTIDSINEKVFAVNLADGDVIVNLPQSTASNEGEHGYIYIETDGAENKLTVNTNGTDSLRGSTTKDFSVKYDGFHIVAHQYGSNHWDVLGWTIDSRTDIVSIASSKTLALTDNGTLQKSTSAAAINVTIPPNSSVAFPIGAEISILQYGAGVVTMVQGSGVTIRSLDSAKKTNGQYITIVLKKIGTDEWLLTGNLVA